MVSIRENSSSSSLDQKTDPKLFPEAIINDTSLYHAGGKAFENDDESFETFYKPIDSYEGIHRYDPTFQWDPKEEKRVVRRIDWRICTWVCFTFFALQLDRSNITQANSDNFLDDLGLTTNDYNTGQTIFYLCFLFAELPSQLISKKLGPDNWIPIQMVCWSLIASFQAFISSRSSFWACRALLGLFEGGFIPDNILYLSYWYTSAELPIRLSFFWFSFQFTSIVSAFLAYGILHMAGINGMEGWRWLFALEGAFTGLVGIVSWWYLPPSPTQTASAFRGKNGWFSEHEEKIMVNRILRDDPSKGDMHNRQAISFSMFWQCLCDYHMWPIYLLGLTWNLPEIPMNAYLTLQLKAAGFSTFHTSLLSIPAFALFIINLMWISWLSEKLNDRFLLGTLTQIWVLPLLIALEVLPTTRNQWVTYALSILLYAQPYIHAVLVAVTSRNGGSVRTRTVATAIYNMSIQVSNIIGVNAYRTPDKPYYFTANKGLIAVAAYNLVLFVLIKLFYVTVNRRRERKWSAMSKEERETYLATTKDVGNKRLDFRFAH